MIDKDILEGLAELNETDLKRIKLLVDNKLNLHKDINVSYRSKNIKCGKESCQKCPHGPYSVSYTHLTLPTNDQV